MIELKELTKRYEDGLLALDNVAVILLMSSTPSTCMPSHILTEESKL